MTVTEGFNPTLISANRVNQLLTCGVAFKYRYLEGLEAERSGSAALYGSAVHRALEIWAPDRTQKLGPILHSAWLDVTEGTTVHDFLVLYQPLAGKAVDLCDAIQKKRPDIKVPRMTRDFKASPLAGEIDKLVQKWLPLLNEGSPWTFTERDPLPGLYEDSLRVMKRYAAKWKHLPAPFETEFHFTVEWNGFTLNGYIDTIEPIIDRETGEMIALGVVDYKSYAKEATEGKDWRQGVIYHVAVEDLIERGVLTYDFDLPLYFCVDYVKLGERRFWEIGDDDRTRLYDELRQYHARVARGDFLPACKSSNPDFCDYPSRCCLRQGSHRIEVNV